MNGIKCARLTAIMAVAVMAMASIAVISYSDEARADSSVEATDFATMKDALLGDNVTVDVVGNILVDESISIKNGSRVNVREGYTLTIDASAMVYNYGYIFVKGTLTNNGDLINYGEPVFDKNGRIEVDPVTGTLTGTVSLAIEDIDTTTRGSAVFQIMYHGVGLEDMTLTYTASSADVGTYEYATILSDGKYTIKIEEGTTYTYDIYTAGKFTIDPAHSVYPPGGDLDKETLVPIAAALIVLSALIILMAAAASRRSKKQ